MSQNMPPSHSGRPDDYPGASQEANYGRADANPYYGQQQAAAIPDLDAGAPLLKSSDVQRLNRKALVFLAGIVALLIAAALWMFNSATAGDEKKPLVKEEEVRIPDLPKSAGEGEVAMQAEGPQLPPLPLAPEPTLPQDPGFPAMPEAPTSHAFDEPRGSSLMERRMGNDSGAGGVSENPALDTGMMSPEAYTQALQNAAQAGAAANGGQYRAPARDLRQGVASAQPILNPDKLLVRGTYIRCVLETRIITDVSGFTSCVVTEPVYSINGRRLLLPKGSKVSGTYQGENVNGPRVSVIWDRITTPTGIDVNMASPGVDNLGGAGHPGNYNAHWPSRIASALMISLISDAFKYAGAKHGPTSTVVTDGGNEVITPYESNTARAMERLANQAIERSANRPATVTINQGEIVNVYVAKDVDFSAVVR